MTERRCGACRHWDRITSWPWGNNRSNERNPLGVCRRHRAKTKIGYTKWSKCGACPLYEQRETEEEQ